MIAKIKPIIYQLLIRYFGNTNETNRWAGGIATNGCGKFADINSAAIESLKQFGATHIWLTGCLRQATLTDYSDLGLPADDPDIVKGRAGSFYAVRDYFDICPDYAIDPADRIAEFEALVARLHDAGLKVLIDFVPNHVARSHQSLIRPDLNFGDGDDQTVFFSPNNSFYYLVDPPGQQLRLSHPVSWQPEGVVFDNRFEPESGLPGRIPKATGDASKDWITSSPSEVEWYESIKLNYGLDIIEGTSHFNPIPRTWLIMDQVLAYWQEKGVDGFRCDMAHLLPKEAWSYLIGNAQTESRNPETYFLAEAYIGSRPHDPIERLDDLLDVGFDAVYHDNSYNRLYDLYRGGSQDAYANEMNTLTDRQRNTAVEYLENHDKPRVAASIAKSGFGSLDANYQLAPLQFLYSRAPVLLLNGQEVGEPGAGAEGFSGDDGRSTFFDYWCMPEFAKWVNNRRYNGARLSDEQKQLRRYLSELFDLCQHELVRAGSHWGLKYFNRQSAFADCPDDLYTYARFASGLGQLLLVVTNFRSGPTEGQIRIPTDLAHRANLPEQLTVHLVFDRTGAKRQAIAENLTHTELADKGFSVTLRNQDTHVYLIAG
ncbi:MAG: alpha-amylase [Bryobacterales bacterium]|nr:alpha-amylase [Bryobacterales bacterium]